RKSKILLILTLVFRNKIEYNRIISENCGKRGVWSFIFYILFPKERLWTTGQSAFLTAESAA
ncbi:MAG: hypothetical protein LUE15_01610, partial [Oscillospiraceae bacterium]|nr:hypothetical protein [Oscillospiraceae bacterium]